MKKFGRIFSLMGLAIFLFGCATTANYQQMVSRWHGQPYQHLTQLWGSPDGIVKMPNGNMMAMYTHQQLVTQPAPMSAAPTVTYVDNTPAVGSGFTGGVTGQTTTLTCRTWFEVNRNGIIVNTQFLGDGCVAGHFAGLVP